VGCKGDGPLGDPGVGAESATHRAPLWLPRTQGEEKRGWHVHYVFFARAGFTDAARTEAESLEASLVDLERLDADLRRALERE